MIRALILSLFISLPAQADWYGVVGLGVLAYRDGDNVGTGEWDDNDGTPMKIEIGWKSKPIPELLMVPRFQISFLHISNWEGGILNDLFSTNRESQLEMISADLCWGDC